MVATSGDCGFHGPRVIDGFTTKLNELLPEGIVPGPWTCLVCGAVTGDTLDHDCPARPISGSKEQE